VFEYPQQSFQSNENEGKTNSFNTFAAFSYLGLFVLAEQREHLFFLG